MIMDIGLCHLSISCCSFFFAVQFQFQSKKFDHPFVQRIFIRNMIPMILYQHCELFYQNYSKQTSQ